MSCFEVRCSRIHGLGVYACRAIPAGTLIGHYAGRRWSPAELAGRQWDDRLTYLYALSDGSMIDGADGGNHTRHLNHACDPNCAAYETDESERAAIEIRALRAIAAGEELLLDYALAAAGADPADHPCRCAGPRCRGTLLKPG